MSFSDSKQNNNISNKKGEINELKEDLNGTKDESNNKSKKSNLNLNTTLQIQTSSSRPPKNEELKQVKNYVRNLANASKNHLNEELYREIANDFLKSKYGNETIEERREYFEEKLRAMRKELEEAKKIKRREKSRGKRSILNETTINKASNTPKSSSDSNKSVEIAKDLEAKLEEKEKYENQRRLERETQELKIKQAKNRINLIRAKLKEKAASMAEVNRPEPILEKESKGNDSLTEKVPKGNELVARRLVKKAAFQENENLAAEKEKNPKEGTSGQPSPVLSQETTPKSEEKKSSEASSQFSSIEIEESNTPEFKKWVFCARKLMDECMNGIRNEVEVDSDTINQLWGTLPDCAISVLDSGFALDSAPNLESLVKLILEATAKGRPICHILNTTEAKGGSHWISLLILPKKFQPFLCDTPFQTLEVPVIQVIDSLSRPGNEDFLKQRIMPVYNSLMKRQLPKQHSNFVTQAPDGNFVFNPITIASTLGQQKDYKTCGLWAIINCLHPVLFGSLYVPEERANSKPIPSKSSPSDKANRALQLENQPGTRPCPYEYSQDEFGVIKLVKIKTLPMDISEEKMIQFMQDHLISPKSNEEEPLKLKVEVEGGLEAEKRVLQEYHRLINKHSRMLEEIPKKNHWQMGAQTGTNKLEIFPQALPKHETAMILENPSETPQKVTKNSRYTDPITTKSISSKLSPKSNLRGCKKFNENQDRFSTQTRFERKTYKSFDQSQGSNLTQKSLDSPSTSIQNKRQTPVEYDSQFHQENPWLVYDPLAKRWYNLHSKNPFYLGKKYNPHLNRRRNLPTKIKVSSQTIPELDSKLHSKRVVTTEVNDQWVSKRAEGEDNRKNNRPASAQPFFRKYNRWGRPNNGFTGRPRYSSNQN
jgi:hypothetical protein